jgi:hypothetical protein
LNCQWITTEIRSDRRELTWSETSSKSARLAKDFESRETVSIAESGQGPLVRCLTQLVNHELTAFTDYGSAGTNEHE